jgi:hypothetical protein
MRGIKILFGTTALLAGLALGPKAQAQVYVNVGVQPVCSYGYYGYEPYACAPMGYYGPGYFYNGIFLGMGPWGGWGYSHGWGSHRFASEGGGRYHGGPGRVSYRASGGARPNAGRIEERRTGGSHTEDSHSNAPHAAPNRGGGGGGHADRESHNGGHADKESHDGGHR